MKEKVKKVLSIFLALALLLVLPSGSFTVHAADNLEIQNNGEGGIYIDINGEKYKRLQQISDYGDYAYGEAGCAWFATARVSELTGINFPEIYGARNWYDNAYQWYEGFVRGGTELERAKALACYATKDSSGNSIEHIAVVEAIEGDRVLISEGGNLDAGAEHGYTTLRWVSKDSMKESGGKPLIGYIYLPVEAEPEGIGGDCGADGSDLKWSLSNDGTLAISGTGDMMSWEMKSEWYEYRSSIKKVIIESGVTSIGDWAFYECENLTEISIPDSVRKIGEYAFSYCSGLQNIQLPDTVDEIGIFAFSYCTALKEFIIPASVNTITMGLFAECTSLTEIVIPEGVTDIQELAFDGCTGIVKIEFRGNVPRIAENAFSGVTATVTYPALNDTWLSENMQQYGGNLTWYSAGEEDLQGAVGDPIVPTSADQKWQGSYVYFGEYQLKEVKSETLLEILKEQKLDENNAVVVDGVRYYADTSGNVEKFYESVPVRWQVLKTTDNSILLLSEKILNAHAFDEGMEANEIKWANSELREWLNNDFYNDCFNKSEQEAILNTELSNATGGELDGGPNTVDKVFLLSAQEMLETKYGFWGTEEENSASRMAGVLPGVENDLTTWTASFTEKYIYNPETETGYYWTRTPYNVRYGFALSPKFVAANGQIGYSNSVLQTWNVGIRPAVQISTDSDTWKTEIAAKAIYLSADQLTLHPGETEQLIATVMPSEYAPQEVIWQSSNPSVASVDQEGNITAVANGSVEISAETVNGITKKCTVTVKDAGLSGDINIDGTVGLADLMLCLNHVSGSDMLSGEALEAADVNGDGKVDLTDLMRILNYTSGAQGGI